MEEGGVGGRNGWVEEWRRVGGMEKGKVYRRKGVEGIEEG